MITHKDCEKGTGFYIALPSSIAIAKAPAMLSLRSHVSTDQTRKHFAAPCQTSFSPDPKAASKVVSARRRAPAHLSP